MKYIGVSGALMLRSIKNSKRANQARMKEFPVAYTGPLVTLERQIPPFRGEWRSETVRGDIVMS